MTDLTKLRRIAEAAKAEAPGEWAHGPSGIVQIRGGNGIIFWDDDGRKAVYPHIATFDPPTVLALLDAIQVLREGLEFYRRITAEKRLHLDHNRGWMEQERKEDGDWYPLGGHANVTLFRADEILKGTGQS